MQPEELRSVFGGNLKARREELGLTQTELAHLAKVSPACISQLESAIHAASMDLLARLAEVLRTSPSALLSAEPVFSVNSA